jgi:hypothetical protein
MMRHRLPWLGCPLFVLAAAIGLGTGCSIAPKSFRKLTDPAPIVRARSVGLGDNLPPDQVIPRLIDRLEDKDRVVRMAAFEELKKETGQTLGYLPWAPDADRAAGVARWREWWNRSQASLAKYSEKR